jgi:LysM repeat protein
MPVATIGLFTMAIVVVAIAYMISQLVGGGGNSQLSPADTVATQAALRTQTPTSGQGQLPPVTQSPQAGGGQTTPVANQTPTTPGAGTTPARTTPAAGGQLHRVESGEFCGSIADKYDITLQQLLTANNMTEDDCTSLQIGQELKIP